jgi:hypothetical protein
MAEATVLSGERRAKADAYRDVSGRATQDAKAEKHRISEFSGPFLLVHFLCGHKENELAPNSPYVEKCATSDRREILPQLF